MSWTEVFRKRSRLARLLDTYAPYRAPFPGPARALTLKQAKDNHAYLLATKPHRLELLAPVLAHSGISLDDYKTESFVEFLEALDKWALTEFPGVFRKKLAERKAWENSNRAGDEIVYSLLMDVALLLGETMVAQSSNCSWTLDLSDDSRLDGMTTYQRSVICVDNGHREDSPVYVDIEQIVVGRYRDCDFPVPIDTGMFKRVVLEAVMSAEDAFDRLHFTECTFERMEIVDRDIIIVVSGLYLLGGHPMCGEGAGPHIAEIHFKNVYSSVREVRKYIGDPRNPLGFGDEEKFVDVTVAEQTSVGALTFGMEGYDRGMNAWIGDWTIVADSVLVQFKSVGPPGAVLGVDS